MPTKKKATKKVATKKKTVKKTEQKVVTSRKKTGKGYVSDGSVLDTYRVGFDLLKQHFGSFLVMILILTAVEVVGRFFSEIPLLGWIFALLIGFLVTAPLQAGASWVFLKAARKEKFSVTDMFIAFKENYLGVVGAAFLMGLFVMVGFVFLIIPGIIIAIRLSFVYYLVIDKKLDAFDAIQQSWDMTRGYSWTIFGVILIAVMLIIAGLIAFLIGIFFSIVWIGSSVAVYYNTVSKESLK